MSSFDYDLYTSLDEWATKNGWQVLHIDSRGLPDRLNIELCRPSKKKTESLPPLGIHVSDKVIAKERLGGGDG